MSGSFHCFHGSFHCFHCFRGNFHGSRFHGSKWVLPWKLPRKFHGSFFRGLPLLNLELVSLPLKFLGACIASVKASTCSVFHFPVRWKLPRNRWKIPWMQWKLPWKQWKVLIFYGIGSFRGCFLWKLPLKLPVALPRKLPRSCVHFHELPHGYLLPFTSTSSHEL